MLIYVDPYGAIQIKCGEASTCVYVAGKKKIQHQCRVEPNKFLSVAPVSKNPYEVKRRAFHVPFVNVACKFSLV